MNPSAQMDEGTLYAIANVAARSRDFEMADQVAKELESLGLKQPANVYNARIMAYASVSKFKEAFRILSVSRFSIDFFLMFY